MSDLTAIVLLALLGSVVALLGGVIFLAVKSWSMVLAKYSVPFAAGVLLTVAMVGLLPEAVHEAGEGVFLVALISFLAAYFFEQVFFSLHHHDHGNGKQNFRGSVGLVIVGDTIHNLIDGVAIAASYLVNPGLGLVTALSTFLHEVPHEMGDFGILLKAGWKRRNVFIVNIISALFTVVGALGVYFWVTDEGIVGNLLAVAAGLFLYLGASDFLPEADRDLSKGKALTALLTGVGLMLVTLLIVPHSQVDEAGHNEEALEEYGEIHVDGS